MARCCASRDERCTPASPKHLRASFAEIAENQPELLARHCTEAGLIEKAAGLWGKAGQRSLARSALVEAIEQLTRALDQIAALPATPALRREQIKLQVALANATDAHQRLCGARDQSGCWSQARSLIEKAEALGEPPEDPLLLFSILYGFWVTNYVGHQWRCAAGACRTVPSARGKANGDRSRFMVAHRLMGTFPVSDRRPCGRPSALRSGR